MLVKHWKVWNKYQLSNFQKYEIRKDQKSLLKTTQKLLIEPIWKNMKTAKKTMKQQQQQQKLLFNIANRKLFFS